MTNKTITEDAMNSYKDFIIELLETTAEALKTEHVYKDTEYFTEKVAYALDRIGFENSELDDMYERQL